ncbi:MAG: hypothetical protein ABH804_01680 [archaeon]
MEAYETGMFRGTIPKKHRFKLFVFFVFLTVLLLIIYTSFYGGLPFTGKIAGDSEPEKNVGINAEFTVPELNLKGQFSEVVLSGSSNSFLQVGNQKFSLEIQGDNYIVFTGYDGEIFFDSEKISKLSGRASAVSVNGVPVLPRTGNTVKVSIEGEFNYKTFKISENAFIKEIAYVTSGVMRIDDGKKFFNIQNEEVSIKSFLGDLEVTRGKMFLEGNLKELKITGDSTIIISA